MSISPSPIWRAPVEPAFPPLAKSLGVDVCVVGGGIAGISAAYFLKRAGKKVCLLERDRLGSGDTGRTTAHLTCVTDVRLTELVKAFGRESATLVWRAGTTAVTAIERIVAEHDIACEFRRVPGFLHAALYGRDDETESLREEAELARQLGFDAEFVAEAPIVNKPGMRISDQAKFRPLEYASTLAHFIDGDGSFVHEHSEVSEVEKKPLAVVANGCKVSCQDIVMATEIPLMGKTGLLRASLLQTKLAGYSSYVVSGLLPSGTLPEISLWDTSDPYYYLRVDREPDGDRVIFGGNDHKTGQVNDTEDCYRRLEKTLSEILPKVEIDHRWSGQVIETNDGLPLIGEESPHQFVATGFNGNGMTFATVAAMVIRDAILKKENPWQELFSVDRKKIRGGTWDYIKENIDFPYYFVADRLKVAKSPNADDVEIGQGKVLKIDGVNVACARDATGRLHRVSAVCTHLGCLVNWNDAEQTWDCPCHGSRFKASGEVLAGPAESLLEPVPWPTKTT
jgi:glycine/D-amino acid oxidase-like deaminating enzyme/nitrite reductase/ring-hydroxylating ferredoxin subunit